MRKKAHLEYLDLLKMRANIKRYVYERRQAGHTVAPILVSYVEKLVKNSKEEYSQLSFEV